MASTETNKTQDHLVIAIDGPAGAGKSTIAKRLAQHLKIFYLDSGAMYRALTLKALRARINLKDVDQLVALAEKTSIDLKIEGNHELKILLDGEDVSREIRSLEVTNNTFHVAQEPRLRTILVQWQRKIAAQKDVVVEGRDIGTVVFPQATKKFYLDADFKERADRRIKELKEKGKDVNEEKLAEDLHARDHKDLSRAVAPLKKAEDAVLIDSTDLSIDEVVQKILKHIDS